jgi:tellurite resistance protein TehA-like permease
MTRAHLAYTVGVLVAILALALAVYYIIPGFYHYFTFSDPYRSHVTHFVVFIGLAICALLGARFIANSSTSTTQLRSPASSQEDVHRNP